MPTRLLITVFSYYSKSGHRKGEPLGGGEEGIYKVLRQLKKAGRLWGKCFIISSGAPLWVNEVNKEHGVMCKEN